MAPELRKRKSKRRYLIPRHFLTPRKLIGLFAAAVAEPEPVAKKAKATKAAPKASPKAEKRKG